MIGQMVSKAFRFGAALSGFAGLSWDVYKGHREIQTYPLLEGERLKEALEMVRNMEIARTKHILFYASQDLEQSFVVGFGFSRFPYRVAVPATANGFSFICGHELTHINEEHIKKYSLVEIASAAFIFAPRRHLTRALVFLVCGVAKASFSRSCEIEADILSCSRLGTASTAEAIQLLTSKKDSHKSVVDSVKEGMEGKASFEYSYTLLIIVDALERLSSSHPPTTNRIEILEWIEKEKTNRRSKE